jgi:adenylate kinase
LGGPGAGKGTQAKLLSSSLAIPCIATGEILRQAIAVQTELGQQAQLFVEQGELVPDGVMIRFIRDRLLQPDVVAGWLLDGYPRTAFQAEELDFLLDDLKQSLDKAILIEVSEPMMINRSLARGRLDDTSEVIQRRIALFRERTTPLVDYYQFRDRLLRINGDQPAEQVHQEILTKLGRKEGVTT